MYRELFYWTLQKLRRRPLTALPVVAAFLFSLLLSPGVSGEGLGAWAYRLLGLGFSYLAWKAFPAPENHNYLGRFAGWLMLLAAAVTAFGRIWFGIVYLPVSISILLAVLAMASYWGAPTYAARLLPGAWVLIDVVPRQLFYNAFLSYPLRYLSVVVTQQLLALCSVSAKISETDIIVRGKVIQITAACSGIEQLEAMLLLGFLLVMFLHRSMWIRICHYLLILPAVIFANALRLAATALLYLRFGDAVFRNEMHSFLGFAMVLTALGVFYLAGGIFEEDGLENSPSVHEKPQKEEPPHA
ncbi:MAG: archaeosortase/exosortase family protein [Victivallaceae bacterium]|nr:archaeosortase/exosortase family protein [Victivallaceae bacterium]